ncbi:MAG TPA: IucA/IucC family siderophore biosynthesis protein [Actinocrinis sp.]
MPVDRVPVSSVPVTTAPKRSAAPKNAAPAGSAGSAAAAMPHGDPDLRRRQAGRALLAKTLGEFAYEQLLEPEPHEDGWYGLRLEAGSGPAVEYRFLAARGSYGSWFVDPGSVRRNNHPAADPLAFIADCAPALGLTGDTAGHLVREMAATLASDTQILATATHTAAQLADLGYAELEGHQTGHPWIVFNKGRIGFSARDTLRYAPEARRPLRLPWIAVRDDLAKYQAVSGLSARRLYTEELSPAARVRFGAELIRQGCNPARYWWLPVHPWQWDEMIRQIYGAEIACGRMVYLGDGDDAYLPQQSIRTFSNIAQPRRRHVKLPLSILNTMVWRGLPTDRTEAAPAVTTWLKQLAEADHYLRDVCKVVLLGEVASVTVGHPVLDRMEGVPYQYREMLGAIWREPLPAALHQGERARTLASLLSYGADGRPLAAELVARSGLDPRAWLLRLFGALLPPLLRFLYAYGVAFSPTGQNVAVIFDGHDVPTRLAVKDFVDDVNISAHDLPELAGLPDAAASVLLREKPEYLCQFLHAGLFVGVFRYLARICEQSLAVPSADFWAMARATVRTYQREFPDHADRYELFDLDAPRIDRLCLNRNRLLLDRYRDRPDRPHIEAFGQVGNPLSTVAEAP